MFYKNTKCFIMLKTFFMPFLLATSVYQHSSSITHNDCGTLLWSNHMLYSMRSVILHIVTDFVEACRKCKFYFDNFVQTGGRTDGREDGWMDWKVPTKLCNAGQKNPTKSEEKHLHQIKEKRFIIISNFQSMNQIIDGRTNNHQLKDPKKLQTFQLQLK